MPKKSQSKLQFSLLLLALILSISAAYYAYAASFSSTVTNPPLQAGAANQLFNFTVNNIDSSKNITQVRITTSANFTYIPNSNGTSASGTSFAGTGPNLGNFTLAGESQALWQYRRANNKRLDKRAGELSGSD